MDKAEFDRLSNLLDKSKYIASYIENEWKTEWNTIEDTHIIDLEYKIADELWMGDRSKGALWTIEFLNRVGDFALFQPGFYEEIKKYNLENNAEALNTIVNFGDPDDWRSRLRSGFNSKIKNKKRSSRNKDWVESDYRDRFESLLKLEGYSTCTEKCIGGSCRRVDIVASKPGIVLIIEVKLTNDRESIWSAFGQVLDYSM